MLSTEERQDLRKRVLMGYKLSLDEARQVIESTRNGAGAAAIAGEVKKATKKNSKPTYSDDKLDADLASLGLG